MNIPILNKESHLKKGTSLGSNLLYPVFLKLENFRTLIIGGGNVGLEKLSALLSNCPTAPILLVGAQISSAVKVLADGHPHVELAERNFDPLDLEGISWVILATDNPSLHTWIYDLCKERNVLLNIADTPELCDMYLGSVVQKGNLKIAISTNGKSPTMAKRLKEILTAHIPEEINESLDNLYMLRNRLQGDFQFKVRELNRLTASLVEDKQEQKSRFSAKLIKVSFWIVVGIGLGILFTSLYHSNLTLKQVAVFFDSTFFLFVIGGFIAQMIDGALGMAYGVSANTFLLSMGIHPAASSASVHTAEIFTSATSGFSHWKLKNIDFNLFRRLLLPGIIGAVLGATLLSNLIDYTRYIKPIVGCYTLFLGGKILLKALRKSRKISEYKHVKRLALVGAFLDSIGGGGWGPIVTTTLVSNGNNPRYTIGSVNLTEFFVTLASSLTFFLFIGIEYWKIIAALILGGVIAAPFGAYLTKRIQAKTLMILVGVIVTLLSLRIIFSSF